jgi:hypothetical protein
MSFIESTQKPNLVEVKIIDRINKVQKLIAIQNITFSQQVYKKIEKFFIENICSLFIFVLLICLLYFRYTEVREKKKKIKNTE